MKSDRSSTDAERKPADDDRTARLEVALRRSEKLASAGRLAASIMHEINNPSQAIGDLVYLLAQEADQPDMVRARAAQIEEQLGRVQYAARQTLSFFRDTPQTQAKDLVPLIDTALRYHAGLLQEKQIGLIKSLPDTLVAWIFPSDLLQLVSNLVRNALEAIEPGGTLRVRLRAVPAAEGIEGRLTISDNGRGIPPSIKKNLFQPFQSDKAEAGNGLGLWISKTLAEKHGGSIRCRSSWNGPTRGTTFVVALPVDGPGVRPLLVAAAS